MNSIDKAAALCATIAILGCEQEIPGQRQGTTCQDENIRQLNELIEEFEQNALQHTKEGEISSPATSESGIFKNSVETIEGPVVSGEKTTNQCAESDNGNTIVCVEIDQPYIDTVSRESITATDNGISWEMETEKLLSEETHTRGLETHNDFDSVEVISTNGNTKYGQRYPHGSPCDQEAINTRIRAFAALRNVSNAAYRRYTERRQ